MNTNWLDDVNKKYKSKNKILFNKDSECLRGLLGLIMVQNRRTIVMWSLEQAEKCVVALKEKYPEEKRPENALIICRKWAEGEVKMPEAKRAILAVHSAAKSMENDTDIALCHAIGQACSSVHVKTHALGLVFYELSSIVLEKGINNCQNAVERRIFEYVELLKYWEENIDKGERKWAAFLLNDKT